jgi:hypothetical protein
MGEMLVLTRRPPPNVHLGGGVVRGKPDNSSDNVEYLASHLLNRLASPNDFGFRTPDTDR